MKPENKARLERRAKKVKVVKKKGNNSLIIGIVAVILLAGIAYAVLSGDSNTKKPQESDIKLPSYAYTNPLTLKAYKYATEHPEMLEQIPCYCGCGSHGSEASDYKPHRFLRDCFINDNWEYDEHASFCDVCIGEAIKVQDYLAKGKTLAEARALIDQEYSRIGAEKTATPPVRDDYVPVLKPKLAAAPVVVSQTPSIDLSGLSLPDNFKSLSDGLKLIPSGVAWAYFANMKQGIGIEDRFMPDANFYGTQIIGILNSEYPDGTFAELHDLGRTGVNVASRAGNDVDHILFTRPYIFDSKDKTDSVLALFRDPVSRANAYNPFKSLLDSVDDENAGLAKIYTDAPSFADASYIGLIKSGNDVVGEIAFRITDNKTVPLATYNELKNSSVARGFKSYEVRQENNILIIKMTSNLNNVVSEANQKYGIELKVFG